MSFSDIDRMEATYTQSSVVGIEQKPVKEKTYQAWELDYADPKDENEWLMVGKVMVRQQEGTRNYFLFLIAAVFVGCGVGIFIGEWDVYFGGMFLVGMVILGLFFCLSDHRIQKKDVQITKVRAIDRSWLPRTRRGTTRRYFLTVIQDDTHRKVEKLRVKYDMYKAFSPNKAVYLVKFGTQNIYAIYEPDKK